MGVSNSGIVVDWLSGLRAITMVLTDEQYKSFRILIKSFENEHERKVQAIHCLKEGDIKDSLINKYENQNELVSKLVCEITPMFLDQDNIVEEITSIIGEERL